MEPELKQIQERNKRVELDKAWETSATRRSLIAGITYIVAALFMYRLEIVDPFINALVPTGGYLLSTLTLPMVKRWWIPKYYK